MPQPKRSKSQPAARGSKALTRSSKPVSSSGKAPVIPGLDGKKNIILILTDQQRAVQWFPPGWEEKHLPAMTFLKRHGMSFSQAVNNTCACTPSRTCVFTGTYPTKNLSNFTLTEFYQTGAAFDPSNPSNPNAATATPFNIPEDNNTNVPTGGPYPAPLSSSEIQLDQTLPNLATILADAGYDTIYKGKFHLGKGVLGYDNNYYEADATRYGFKQWDPPDAGQDAQIQNYGGGNADNDGRFIEDTVAFLQDRVAHPDRYTKPFCLILSLVNPHDVLGYPNNWVDPTNNGGYGPKDLLGKIGLPPTIDENLTENYKPTSQQNWLTLMGSLEGIQRRNYLNFYGNLMSLVDRQIMRVLDVLRKPKGRKLWEDTMIVRTSDHGEMGLTHGGSRQKWFNVYQETIKVPLVWSNPVMFPEPVVSDSLVSLVDLLPTLASFCGAPNLKRYGMQGRDYSSLFTNPKGKIQDYTYYINTDVKAGQAIPASALPPNQIAMVRDANFKYARYYGSNPAGAPPPEVQEEFYNLRTDLDPATGEAVELQNKSDWAIEKKGAPWRVTPGEKKKRAELKTLLAKAMKNGVLSDQSSVSAPLPMSPRAKTVTSAWPTADGTKPEVYQVIFYSQRTYSYRLQISTNGEWSDVPSTTDMIPTTQAGNNGPILFQPQPKLPSQPVYRVARKSLDGQVTYEDVVWTDYTMA